MINPSYIDIVEPQQQQRFFIDIIIWMVYTSIYGVLYLCLWGYHTPQFSYLISHITMGFDRAKCEEKKLSMPNILINQNEEKQ